MQKKNSSILRLLLLFSPLIIVAIALIYFPTISVIEKRLAAQHEQELVNKLHLAARIVGGLSPESWNPAVMGPLADELANFTESEVVILTRDGTVLGDSSRSLAELLASPNLLASADIQQATQSGFGRALRISSRRGVPVLDLTITAGTGLVRLEADLQNEIPGMMAIRGTLLASLLSAIMGGALCAAFLARATSYQSTVDSSVISGAPTQREEMREIINSIAEGVMVTDPSGRITLVNTAFCQLFAIAGETSGKTAIECLRNRAIDQAIRDALNGVMEVRFEISVLTLGGEKIFDILTAPLGGTSATAGTVSILHDITQIRKLESLRQEFVANVSHEFKTPLTSIVGYSETLLSERATTDSASLQQRFIGKIHRNAVQLRTLVDDVLLLSRLESGAPPVFTDTLDLNDLLTSVTADFMDRSNSQNQNLQRIMGDSKIHIMGHVQEIRMVLANLLDNALKYSPPGGTITLSCTHTEGWATISVSDTGIGIAPEDQERIFERFYRVDRGRSRDRGGTGLGLAIAKHVVQRHGGEIRVMSTLEKGSTFSVVLPLAPPV